MKTTILTKTLAAVIALGITLPAMAADNGASTTPAVASDKPQVKILFRHTSEAPYDIRALSWCGGLATRVQIVPMTGKTIIVAYNTGDLGSAKITGAAPSRIGFKMCKNGKTTTLCDILCLEKKENILPNLVTRVSGVTEWRLALDLQDRGLLNAKNFARTSLSEGQYASNR